MKKDKLVKVINLLGKLNKAGYKINLEQGKLLLKFPKEKKIDENLVKELKTNKNTLIDYFKNHMNGGVKNEFDRTRVPLEKMKHRGEIYYEVGPTQSYWLDDKKDREFKENDDIHGSVLYKYNLHGNFNIDIFRQSIFYLIERHESLRTTFHELNGTYYMKIGNVEPGKVFNFLDSKSGFKETSSSLDFINFKDHEFDLGVGPIFLSRVKQIGPNDYTLSFKVHHIVFDNVTNEILFRDLLVAYQSLSLNQPSTLPLLQFQYKENLALINSFIRKNGQIHREYWEKTHPHMPKELLIPGKQKGNRNSWQRICKIERFEIEKEFTDKLKFLASKFSTSLFVILQTTFKTYLQLITGQNDIIIGTYISGRDHPCTDNQIGCYAKTVLIRTVLDHEDSFHESIAKVIKSNEDLYNYGAYSLHQYLEEKLFSDQTSTGAFWNFNLQFNDFNSNYLSKDDFIDSPEELQFELKPQKSETNTLIAIDMQIKFFNLKNSIQLQVEYDSSLYRAESIQKFIKEYIFYTNNISTS